MLEKVLEVKALHPDPATNNLNCFILQGETTVSNLTIKDFYYDNVNDTGWAFSFANNFEVTPRSLH